MELLFKALIPAAVLTVFALARRYMPAPSTAATNLTLDELSARFNGMQWVINACIIVVGVAFAWSTHALLVALNRHFSFAQSPEGFRLWPQPAIWWFLPGMGALSLSYDFALFLWACFGNPEETALYDLWNSQKAGFDARRILRWMGLLIVFPIGIATLLATPMHSTLRSLDIVDCGYAFKACETYRYSDATRVTEIQGFRDRDGKLTPRAGIVIDFKDGRRWSSADWGDFHKTVDPELEKIVTSRTKLPLKNAVSESDIQ